MPCCSAACWASCKQGCGLSAACTWSWLAYVIWSTGCHSTGVQLLTCRMARTQSPQHLLQQGLGIALRQPCVLTPQQHSQVHQAVLLDQ